MNTKPLTTTTTPSEPGTIATPAGTSRGGSKEEIEAAAERQRQIEEKRHEIARSVMEPQALERLNRLALVKPDRAAAVEAHLTRLAPGLLAQGRVITEQELVSLLQELSGVQASTTDARGPNIQIKHKNMSAWSDSE